MKYQYINEWLDYGMQRFLDTIEEKTRYFTGLKYTAEDDDWKLYLFYEELMKGKEVFPFDFEYAIEQMALSPLNYPILAKYIVGGYV